MVMSRVCVVLLWLLVTVPCLAVAGQQETRSRQPRCAGSIPPNVDAGLFTGDVLALLRRSDTFRAQCERVAADPRVRVRLSVVATVDGGGRAETTFHRYRTGALVAEVAVLFGENYRELLAHEFEHIIEQLDGVDLRREAADGRAWQVASGAFETRRALLAGVQVLEETGMPAAARFVARRATRQAAIGVSR